MKRAISRVSATVIGLVLLTGIVVPPAYSQYGSGQSGYGSGQSGYGSGQSGYGSKQSVCGYWWRNPKSGRWIWIPKSCQR